MINDQEEDQTAPKLLEQFASEVTDFSSQYGNENSISYIAKNLAGPSTIYPAYGDFTQACVFRTYGPWWDKTPSKKRSFTRTPPSFCSQDYIEVSFDDKVYPYALLVCETYNPGCIVRILACEEGVGTDVDTGKNNAWKLLWDGPPEEAEPVSRIFSPPLKQCPFKTKLIRLELCHRLAHYYTELESVKLIGSEVTLKADPLASETLWSQLSTVTLHDTQLSSTEELSDNGQFDKLPVEVIQLVLSFLDHLSLCRVARTSSLLYTHCYDSLQYTELNLQPHWTQVTDLALDSLHTRCQHLQSLNLSWCHGNLLSPLGFSRFITSCGKLLTCLYLSSCSFLVSQSIEQIAKHCPNLTELDLDSCRTIEGHGLLPLKHLVNLKRLNLYRTAVDYFSILAIIRACPKLEHLNIGSCILIRSLDEVITELSKNCKNLKSLDLWRLRSLTDAAVLHLAQNCPLLEELDLGWCSNLTSNSDCFVQLIRNCRKLKKLFLTANRSVSDQELEAIAKCSSDMEQLDILGTRQVTVEAAQRVLENCKKLIMFDVSFCSNIDFETVEKWEKLYPHVSIKKSYQQ